MHALREILLAEIHAGTPPDRIVLGGFSQGGAVALFTGFTSQHTLAGVVVTSGWVPALGSLESVRAASLIWRRILLTYILADGHRERTAATRFLGSRSLGPLGKVGVRASIFRVDESRAEHEECAGKRIRRFL